MNGSALKIINKSRREQGMKPQTGQNKNLAPVQYLKTEWITCFIQRISCYPADKMYCMVGVHFIHWIELSALNLDNRCLEFNNIFKIHYA